MSGVFVEIHNYVTGGEKGKGEKQKERKNLVELSAEQCAV